MSAFTLNLGPHRYLKGAGLVNTLPEILAPYGRRAFVLFDPLMRRRYGERVEAILKRGGLDATLGALERNCCVEEGKAWIDRFGETPPDCVVGVGGGKAIDLAKWIAFTLGRPFIAVPTSTATCAAVTGISPLYTPEGIYRHTVPTAQPVATLVDADIVLTQPARLLTAGMADSMAKWIEAKGMRKQHHKRILSASALSLARLIYEFLTRKGTRALEDLQRGAWTETLSEVVDICLLTTGLVSTLGGKKVRVSAAHAFQDAFIGLGSKKDVLHGELVAFGILVQLVLEKVSESLIHRHLILFSRWGLPLTLDALGIDPGGGYFEAGLARMLGKTSPIHNLVIPVTASQVREAIMKADAMGKRYLALA